MRYNNTSGRYGTYSKLMNAMSCVLPSSAVIFSFVRLKLNDGCSDCRGEFVTAETMVQLAEAVADCAKTGLHRSSASSTTTHIQAIFIFSLPLVKVVALRN